MDISDLANEFDLCSEALQDVLAEAQDYIDRTRKNMVHPANKEALRGVAKKLDEILVGLSDETVLERLRQAVCAEPEDPDEESLARYIARCEARDRVASAMAGAHDLLAIVRDSDEFKLARRRPAYKHWPIAVRCLLEFWQRQGRKFTVSAHPDDGRTVRACETLLFIHPCLEHLGEKVTLEACRRVLCKLKKKNPGDPGDYIPGWEGGNRR